MSTDDGTGATLLHKADVEQQQQQQQQEAGKATSELTVTQWAWKLLVAVLCGLVFGTAIHKSGVFNATVLRDQFNFRNSIMLQTFLFATATSTLTIAIMNMTRLRDIVKKTEAAYRCELGIPMSVFGTFVLGVGMTVAGACPGTVWVQLGSGSVRSLVTIGGGLTAAAIHGMVFDAIEASCFWKPIPSAKATIADQFDDKWRPYVGMVMAAVIAGGGLVAQALLPSHVPFWPSSFNDTVWNPALCGMMIGALQLPLTVALTKNVGSASTMQTLAAMAFLGTHRFKLLDKMKYGIGAWWQVTYILAATVMATVCVAAAGGAWYRGDDITPLQGFIGGFLIIFGARLAGGCTSGHGISGAGHLMWRSYMCIVAMLAGAIAARYVLM